MGQIFSEFNKESIKNVEKFYYGDCDVLIFEAPSGAGKNKIIQKGLSNVSEEYFLFYAWANENSTSEDFLLNFYDTLRNYSMQKRLSLKKDVSSNFAQKISNYLKLIPSKTLIVIDNYEKIENNSKICNFLVNIAKNKNIKLILLTRTKVDDLIFKINNVSTNYIQKKEIEESEFLYKIQELGIKDDLENHRKLFEYSNKNHILIITTIDYIKTTGTLLGDLLIEFEKRKQTFENFIISKVLSLVSNYHLEIIKTMCMADGIFTIKFFETYNIANPTQIEYLKNRHIINETEFGIYIFEHIRKFILLNLSAGEKLSLSLKLIEIYKNELAKSPKNRLIRLSREGIRLKIETLKQNTPSIKTNIPKNVDVSYFLQAQETEAPWLIGKTATDKVENKIEEITQQEDKNIIKQINRNKYLEELEKQKFEEEHKEELLKSRIENAKKHYEFEEAIQYLLELLKITKSDFDKNTTIKDIAENYFKLGEKEKALSYYTELAHNCKSHDEEKYYQTLLSVAKMHKELYELDLAKKVYQKIADRNLNSKITSKAYFELGNIYNKENNKDEAFNSYLKCLEYEEETDTYCNACYMIAIIYETKDEIESAKKYYEIAINKGKEEDITASCYLNLGLILSDEGKNKEAINCFKNSIKIYEISPEKNYGALYFANINMSYIYKIENQEKQKYHIEEALKWAKKLEDEFEITNSYVELGDYYYNQSQNREALLSYLKALDTLNEDKSSKNHLMIQSRIEDMKYKMGSEFKEVENEYRNNN